MTVAADVGSSEVVKGVGGQTDATFDRIGNVRIGWASSWLVTVDPIEIGLKFGPCGW